ncbi:hypothetical protein AAG570_013999, partial [Ranatra chinensis]
DFRLHVATWNVAEGEPPDDVEELLGVKESPLPDMVVIGLQEITMKPGQAIINNIFDDKWTRSFDITLSKFGYEKVKTKRMVGIVLNIFVLLEHSNYVRDVFTEGVPTGWGGLFGNKGAVAISMDLYGKKMRFVNSHLHAHDGQLAKRIEDYHIIVRELRDTTQPEFSFWLGDLNFRLNEPFLEANTILRRVLREDFESLLAKDELKAVMRDGSAFATYSEQDIHFRPTYKMIHGMNDYNTKRKPAWTDRILYVANPKLSPNKYTSLINYWTSDHRPVIAVFDITLDKPTY